MTPPLDPSLQHAPAATGLRAALFIDLAGVLLDTAPGSGPHSEQLRGQLPGLRGGVGAALRLLDRLDYRIVVLGPCALDRRQASHILPDRIADLLARERVVLAGCCCCDATRAPCDACPPDPGLLLRAAQEHGLALTASWLLARDMHYLAAGRRAGCRTVLVGDGDDAWPAQRPSGSSVDGPAAYQARDIVDAALAIVRLDGER